MSKVNTDINETIDDKISFIAKCVDKDNAKLLVTPHLSASVGTPWALLSIFIGYFAAQQTGAKLSIYVHDLNKATDRRYDPVNLYFNHQTRFKLSSLSAKKIAKTKLAHRLSGEKGYRGIDLPQPNLSALDALKADRYVPAFFKDFVFEHFRFQPHLSYSDNLLLLMKNAICDFFRSELDINTTSRLFSKNSKRVTEIIYDFAESDFYKNFFLKRHPPTPERKLRDLVDINELPEDRESICDAIRALKVTPSVIPLGILLYSGNTVHIAGEDMYRYAVDLFEAVSSYSKANIDSESLHMLHTGRGCLASNKPQKRSFDDNTFEWDKSDKNIIRDNMALFTLAYLKRRGISPERLYEMTRKIPFGMFYSGTGVSI